MQLDGKTKNDPLKLRHQPLLWAQFSKPLQTVIGWPAGSAQRAIHSRSRPPTAATPTPPETHAAASPSPPPAPTPTTPTTRSVRPQLGQPLHAHRQRDPLTASFSTLEHVHRGQLGALGRGVPRVVHTGIVATYARLCTTALAPPPPADHRTTPPVSVLAARRAPPGSGRRAVITPTPSRCPACAKVSSSGVSDAAVLPPSRLNRR